MTLPKKKLNFNWRPGQGGTSSKLQEFEGGTTFDSNRRRGKGQDTFSATKGNVSKGVGPRGWLLSAPIPTSFPGSLSYR